MEKTQKDYYHLLPFFRSQILIFGVSLFEYYIKDVVEDIYLRKSDVFKTMSKSVTYEKLLTFSDLNELHKYIIEKECHSLGYMSYEELSNYFLKLFKIDFSKSGIRQEDLVETFATRNVLVHNRGIVNRSFLQKVKKKRYKLGNKIEVTEKIMLKSLDSIEKHLKYIDSCVVKKFKGMAGKFTKDEE